MSRARRRDRRVYLRSHPFLFALLSAARVVPVLRLGRTVLVHTASGCLDALTRVPLDRAAAGTTGGAARRLDAGGLLFDQEGEAHRRTRRRLAEHLGRAGVARLRPVWTEVLDRRVRCLAEGGDLDLVPLTAELAGATLAALLRVDVDPLVLARAAAAAAATGVQGHLPGPFRLGRARAARRAAARLTTLVADGAEPAGPAAMLAVAAVNTTVAGLPRAAAWCADEGLWAAADDPRTRPILVEELLRVTAPSPLLPRVAAGAGSVAGHPVRPGDRLALVIRHAVDAHRLGPDLAGPTPPQVAQLVFGAGPHACPGAQLARAQLSDLLAALAPHRPKVVRAVADRRSALPGWAKLVVRAEVR
ncbi:MAG TPA: cytochrome P450 [Micromonosporaceae bacterium]